MACEQKKTEVKQLLDVAVFSIPGAGHVIPFCELCRRLAADFGCKITFILYQSSHSCPRTGPCLDALKSSGLPIDLLFIPDPQLSDPSLRINERISLAALSCEEPVWRLVRETRPACLITDMFCTNLIDAAADEGIPTQVFLTMSAAYAALVLEMPVLAEQIRTALKDVDFGIQFPGLPCVPARRLPESMKEDPSGPLFQEFVHSCLRVRRAAGICVNTMDAMEGPLLALLQKRFRGSIPPLYAVGPIVSGSGRTKPETEEYLKWLDLQAAGSVVYVSFGSGATMSSAQVAEIARGLEMSGCRFLWVVRLPAELAASYFEAADVDGRFVEDILPGGFVERTRDQGRVVSAWAAQMDVLSHEAVGGFVSHCGWNSTVESIVWGVPIVAWPMFAEQHVNAAIVSEVFGVGIRVEMDDDNNGFVSAEELQRRVVDLMWGDAGKKVRERVKELQREACDALQEGGSSWNAMAAAVSHWKSSGTDGCNGKHAHCFEWLVP